MKQFVDLKGESLTAEELSITAPFIAYIDLLHHLDVMTRLGYLKKENNKYSITEQGENEYHNTHKIINENGINGLVLLQNQEDQKIVDLSNLQSKDDKNIKTLD